MLVELWQGEALEGAYRLMCYGDLVFWLRKKAPDQPFELFRLDPGGGAPRLVASDREPMRAVVLDAQYIYLTAIDRVLRVPNEGGPAIVLARGEPQASDLLADDQHLYWTNRWFGQTLRGGPRGPLDGTVRRMPKKGGAVESILDGGDSLDLIGQDAGVLFLSTGNELVALPKTGGPRRVLWRGEQSIMAGAVGDDRVYAATGGELISVPKRGGAKDVLARAEILLDVVVLDGWVYLARNESHARGGVSQTAALLRLPAEGGDVEELPGLSHLPAKLAACGSGVYAIDAPLLGRPGAPRLLVVK